MTSGIKRSSSHGSIQQNLDAAPVQGFGKGPTSWQTRFKQAACLGLLSSPLAAAAQPELPALRSGGRHLLASNNPCVTQSVVGPYAASIKNLSSGLPNTTLAVLGDAMWAQAWCSNGQQKTGWLNNTGGKGGAGLSYIFGADLGLMPNNYVVGDMRGLPAFLGLNTWEVDSKDSPPDLSNFIFGTSNTAGNPWQTTGLDPASNDDQGQAHVYINLHDSGNTDNAWRLSTLAQGLGLKSRTSPGYGGKTYDIGDFPKDTLSSVTFTASPPCANITRLGALDLAALASFYGFSTAANSNLSITMDDYFGVGGMITPATGNNSLVAQSQSWRAVQIYLPDDGAYDTLVGYSRGRLAPGSVITNADISGTYGGIIVGNGYPNAMIGSKNNDSFVVWGPANITTNGGYDLVYVNAQETSVHIRDFNKNSTLWFNDFGSAPKVAAYNGGGTVVTNADKSVAYIANMAPQDVKPLINLVSTPQLSANVSATTDLVQCIGDLKLLNITSNPPAPVSPGKPDPCESSPNPCACLHSCSSIG